MSTEARNRVDVLHICFGGLGGHAGVIQPLVAEMGKRGISSAVILYAPPEELTAGPTWSIAGKSVSVAKRGRVDLRGLSSIAMVVRRLQPRIVLSHTSNPTIAAAVGQLLGRTAPRIFLVEHQAIGLRSRADQARSLLSLALTRGVIVLSEDYAARYPFRKLPLPSVKQLRIIPNGVDVDLFRPANRLNESEPGHVTIGMVSRLIATKDVATLIEAMAILTAEQPHSGNVSLRIAGDGTERERLEALVDELDLRDIVVFSGTLDEAGVVEFLQGLSIYVHATHGETLSTAILQAYAVSLPVIASDVEGVSNLVRDGEDGLLVRERDPRALAAAIEALIADPERRVLLGSAARDRAEADFSVSAMADRYLDLFDAIDPRGRWMGSSAATE